MDHPANLALLLAQPTLPACLGAVLALRCTELQAGPDDAEAVLAAHSLIHVAGHMMVNGARQDGSSTFTAPQGAPLVELKPLKPKAGEGGVGVAPASKDGKRLAVYISLDSAAKAVKVVLPAVPPLVKKDGSPGLAPSQLADLSYAVRHGLPEKLADENMHRASQAAACL